MTDGVLSAVVLDVEDVILGLRPAGETLVRPALFLLRRVRMTERLLWDCLTVVQMVHARGVPWNIWVGSTTRPRLIRP